jgi:hypothetical protein
LRNIRSISLTNHSLESRCIGRAGQVNDPARAPRPYENDKAGRLEAAITSLFARHSTEWDADILFKKPWTLSKKVEFMFGVGPEWVHTRQNGLTGNSVAGEAVLDFMFWPSVKRRFGWYLEPGYEYNFGRGHEKSVGISFGLLIAIQRR